MSATQFDEYARDESRFTGECTGVVLANREEDIAAAIEAGEPFTVQGARTGITGACVPSACKALCLAGFSGICGLREEDGGFSVAVRPGTLLLDLRNALGKKAFATEGWPESSLKALERFQNSGEMMFAPDPTEDTAAVGGMFATNAGGPASLLYGRTGDNTAGLDVRLANGELWHIERGAFTFDETGCPLPNGKRLCLSLPGGAPLLKPLQPRPGADLIDLFAGSEGMLGVVERLWLKLIPKPAIRWNVVFFPETVECAAGFMDALLAARKAGTAPFPPWNTWTAAPFRCFLPCAKSRPGWPPSPNSRRGAACAVIAELCAESAEDAEAALGELLELFLEAGGDEDATWAADTADEIEKFRLLRHAVPEAVNSAIDLMRVDHPSLTKLAADVCQKGASLSALLPELTEKLESLGMDHALFGHGGERHFHVNLIPKDEGEYQKGAEFLFGLAAETAKEGGLIVAENGVGKLKRGLIQKLLPKDHLELMREIKRFFDPARILNPNNML